MYKYVFPLLIAGAFIVSHSLAASPPQEEKLVIKSKGSPVLGVILTTPDDDELSSLNLHGGAKIKKVIKGSEAERIGLKEGDIIIRFEGSDIADPEDLREMVSQIEDEKKVEIVIMRDGKEQKLEATLKPGETPFPGWRGWRDEHDFDFRLHDLPYYLGGRFDSKGGFLGVEARQLTDQLKQYFEVEYGVLVERVIEESPAEKAGLKAGDIITEINKRKIEDYRDLVRTVNYYNPGETIEVKYTRKGKSNTVKVELGEKKRMKWHHSLPKSDLDLQGYLEEHLGKSMKQLEDNLKDLEKNLQNIELKFVVI